MTREISIAKHNLNAKKNFEDWCNKEYFEIGTSTEDMFNKCREYALREAIEACTDENSKNNIENLI